MRIHVKKISNDEPVYGALNFEIIKFIGKIQKDQKEVFVFETKNHGQVYADFEMTRRIAERLRINRIDNTLFIRAINLN